MPPGQATRLVRCLTREDPMMVWMPTYEVNEEGGEYLRIEEQNPFTPWIVSPSGGIRLDERDPFGVRVANHRPFLSKEFASSLHLVRKGSLRAQVGGPEAHDLLAGLQSAWGREEENSDGSNSGVRLFCSRAALREILKKHDKEVLLLIKLERYERGSYQVQSKYTHTVAVVRIKQTLDCEFYRGAVNKLHVMKY